MIISDDGLEFIKQAEGCRLVSYRDSVGVLTVGYGHTQDVHGGMAISEAQAEAYLRSDLEDVYRCIKALVNVPLNQGQFDALCSWIFNLGCGNFKSSTLLKVLNRGDYADVGAQIVRWDKAGGKVLAGLTKRREGEAEMFSEVA